jgi:hypothetical protein
VRAFGGVLEHPEASHAWRRFGLLPPPRNGGWVAAGDMIGWTCCVEQGHYGHRARKATWLYAVVTCIRCKSNGTFTVDALCGACRHGEAKKPPKHKEGDR